MRVFTVELITTAVRALTCCQKEDEVNSEMVKMSASMPMLLDSILCSSIFVGVVCY